MRFKTLEIQGFKSFPDKTVLTFDSRTTAVVGSNGNGKSNISDALRWVMGEQGVKTLRGEKMEDVIFYGTQTRKSMGFAKVALTIDNEDRRLPLDSDEVVIARTLYRTGESEYRINGEKSRLKDIGTLFMGTGLGRDGYSIIGQGRIDEIVNSKANNRRELFEEAAGVSKFLFKKAGAVRELGRTEDNLLRLLDIETELKTRLPILEKQAEKANKAFALKEEERAVGVSLSVRELEHISRDLEETDNAVLLNQGECEHFDREITELELELESISEAKRGLVAETEHLRRQGESAKDDIAGANTKIAVMESDIVHNEGRIAGIKEQIELSEKSGDEFLRQTNDFNEQIEDIKKEITGIEQEQLEQNKALSTLDEQSLDLDAEHKEMSRRIGELHMAKSAAEIYISRAEENITQLQSQLDEAQSLIDGQADEKQNLETKKSELQSQLDTLLAEKEETANKLSGYSRLYESKAAKLEETRHQLDDIKKERQKSKTRFDVLSDVERSMAGYYGSVKSVLQAVNAGRFSARDVVGTVADIVKVDGEYALAAEIALGSALQNVIVSSESIAKRCIAFLKEGRSGRATFLPLTSVKGNALEIAGLSDEEGFVGLGHEIAGCEPKYTGIIKSLLGRTAFAEDIDSATAIAKKYGYKFKIVTLDGQVINAGGSFTGGYVKKSEGIISRKRELADLQKLLRELEEKIETAKPRHDQLAAECAKMKLECEGMSESLSRLSGEEIRLKAELGGAKDMLSQFTEQLENSEATLNRCKTRIAEERDIITSNNAEHDAVVAELTEKNELLAKSQDEAGQLVKQRGEIAERVSDLNMKRITKGKDIENLLSQIENIKQIQAKSDETRESLFKDMEELKDKNTELNEAIAKKKQDIDSINDRHSQNKAALTELTVRGEEHEKRITLINGEIREKITHKERFSNSLAAAIERRSGLERKSEDIKAALFDEYEMTPTEAVRFAEEKANLTFSEAQRTDISDTQFIKETRNRLHDIRKRLTALGDVNYASITELALESERYGVLSEQLKDVRKAKSALEKLIAELSLDIRTRFIESFNDINWHFSRIFAELFGGGSARLELVDTPEPEESSESETERKAGDDTLPAGVEIFVALPGKISASLTLLSGGEKAFVAIALSLAILCHRPTPFCMLDEVDAALDEVNVNKYINYLKRYSATTQLMMITHRRETIEGCDVLYGVFMQEKGVSRLLKQEIGDGKD